MTGIRKQRNSRRALVVVLSSCLVLAACAAVQRPSAPVVAADSDESPVAPTPGIKPLTLEQEEMISQ